MNEENTNVHVATFAGGCFWCLEADFAKLPGVVKVVSGYTGGYKHQPTYEEVCTGETGHYEVVQVIYDPSKITYELLLDFFWRHIDPTDSGGQFVDRGSQYRTAIFYHDEQQQQAAENSRNRLKESGIFPDPIVTEVVKFTTFYAAEDYHQNYSARCPMRYRLYREGTGRDRFLGNSWDG